MCLWNAVIKRGINCREDLAQQVFGAVVNFCALVAKSGSLLGESRSADVESATGNSTEVSIFWRRQNLVTWFRRCSCLQLEPGPSVPSRRQCWGLFRSSRTMPHTRSTCSKLEDQPKVQKFERATCVVINNQPLQNRGLTMCKVLCLMLDRNRGEGGVLDIHAWP